MQKQTTKIEEKHKEIETLRSRRTHVQTTGVPD